MTPNTRRLLSSTETIYIYASVQQFEPVQNQFIIPPLSLNWNLNLQFSSVQFGLCKLNRGSVQVQFRFKLISKPNFGSTTRSCDDPVPKWALMAGRYLFKKM